MRKLFSLFVAIILVSCGGEKIDIEKTAEKHAKNYCACIEPEASKPEADLMMCHEEHSMNLTKELDKGDCSEEEHKTANDLFKDITELCELELENSKKDAQISSAIDKYTIEYCDCINAVDAPGGKATCRIDITSKFRSELLATHSIEKYKVIEPQFHGNLTATCGD